MGLQPGSTQVSVFVDLLLRGPRADAALLVPPSEPEFTGADSAGLGSTLWGLSGVGDWMEPQLFRRVNWEETPALQLRLQAPLPCL